MGAGFVAQDAPLAVVAPDNVGAVRERVAGVKGEEDVGTGSREIYTGRERVFDCERVIEEPMWNTADIRPVTSESQLPGLTGFGACLMCSAFSLSLVFRSASVKAVSCSDLCMKFGPAALSFPEEMGAKRSVSSMQPRLTA